MKFNEKCAMEKENIIVNREWCKKVKCYMINKCEYLKSSEQLFSRFIVETQLRNREDA